MIDILKKTAAEINSGHHVHSAMSSETIIVIVSVIVTNLTIYKLNVLARLLAASSSSCSVSANFLAVEFFFLNTTKYKITPSTCQH